MVALDRTNLRSQAIALLRTRILSGELESGKVYSATVLGTELGVSPTPIREAMLDLAADDLVEVVPNKGYKVTVPTEQDLNEIAELRLMLEVPAVKAVVAEATDADLERLEAPVEKCARAAADGDLPGFLLADREFHLELIGHARNARLQRLVAALRDQTRLVGLKGLSEAGLLGESAAEHRAILDAVKARETRRAQKLMREHLTQTRGLWAGVTNGRSRS